MEDTRSSKSSARFCFRNGCSAAANAAGRGFCCGRRAGCWRCCCVAACAGVLWLRSAAIAALPVLDGDVHLAGLSGPGDCPARCPRRAAHRGGYRGRSIRCPGLCDRAGPALADGHLPAQRQRGTGGGDGSVDGGARPRAARAAVSQYGAAGLCESLRRRPRPLRRLCARSESLHRAASGLSASGVQAAALSAATMARRGLGQSSA